MSFFKDFKDDLSQAVNELMPEEGGAVAASPQMVDTISETSAPIGQDDLAELEHSVFHPTRDSQGNDVLHDEFFWFELRKTAQIQKILFVEQKP